MKHLICILFLFTIGFTACRQHTSYPLAMQQAKSLMNARPDSAWQLLQGMEDTVPMLPEEARMYWHLLTIQAKDKLYITHTDDSLINRIVQYYEVSDDKDRLMMAYYYQGSTYRDMNDAPRALKAFYQVLKLGESYPPCDLFARTYNQIGTLFAYQGLYDESLEANKKAAEQFILQGKKTKISYALRDIARIYAAKSQQDSALHYYQTACQTALNDKDTNRYYSILGELGGVYYSLSDFDMAKKLLEKSLRNYPKTPANTYALLGAIHQSCENLDSAIYYFNKMHETGDIRKQYHAHQHLFQVLMKQNKCEEAMEHYHAAYALDDSIVRFTATEALAKINALYNYQRTEETNIQLQLTQERQTRTIWALSFFLLLSLSTAGVIYLHIRNKHQELLSKEQTLLKQAENNYANSLKQVDENSREIDKLNSLLNEKENKSKQLERELTFAKKELLVKRNELIIASNKEKELSEQVFMESDIYSLFHKAAFTPGLNLSTKEWNSLHRHFCKTYPDFLSKIQELYPNPSERELRICLLLKMKISLTGIANLLNSSKSSVTNARTRLYEKIFGKKGKASDLDKFIAEL